MPAGDGVPELTASSHQHDNDDTPELGWRVRCEAAFERAGRAMVRWRTRWLAVVVALAALPLLALPRLELDSSSQGFLHDSDPEKLRYEAYREAFGRDVPLLVMLESDTPFDRESLAILRTLHRAIESEVPRLEQVTSLLNAPALVRGEGNTLFSRSLEREWPQEVADEAAFRQRVLDDSFLKGRLVSHDGRALFIAIHTEAFSELPSDGVAGEEVSRRFITAEEDAAIVAVLRSIIDREAENGVGARVSLVGAPVLALELQRAMRSDMVRFTLLSLLVIVALLAMLFRRTSGVWIPVLAVACAAGGTLGVMALLGTPVRAPTQILPSFILAVGVCGSLHLLVAFYRAYDAGASVEAAMGEAFRHAALPIALAGGTTIAGLLSFRSASIAPIAEFGTFAPVGVLFSLAYTFCLVPALLSVAPLHRRSHGTGTQLVSTLLAFLGRRATRAPWAVVAFWGLAIVLAGVGIARIELSHDPLRWFKADHPVRVATEASDDALRGLMSLEVLLRSEKRNGVLDPDFANSVHAFSWAARGLEVGDLRPGHVFSAVDVLERVHHEMDPDDPNPLPARRRTLMRDAFLLDQTISGASQSFIDRDRKTLRVSIRVPWTDAAAYPALIERVVQSAEATIGNRAAVEVTGATALMSRLVNAVLGSLAKSYLIALALITPLIALLVGNWRAGAIAMVPNLAPIWITLGAMGWAGIPLDVFTMLVACIAIGLAVDDTIRFVHGFEGAFAVSGDVGNAVDVTLQSTGRALLFTSLVLAAGFSTYTLASLNHIGNFGWLMALAISLAFAADIVLAPALLTLWRDTRRAANAREDSFFARMEADALRLDCSPRWLETKTLPDFSFSERGASGPTLVLFHGLFGAISNWEHVTPKLEKFARVVALDFPLYSGDRSEVTVQALALYAEAFLRKQGLSGVTLCGNSLGGHVALRMTRVAPDLVKAMVLTGSSGLYEHDPSRMPLRPGEDFVREQMGRVFQRDEFITDEGVASVLEVMRSKRMILNVIQAARSAKLDNMQALLHEIDVPTLLLWGQEDQVTPMAVAETFLDLLPDARLRSIGNCGHAPMIEEPDWFAEQVERFFAELD